MAKEEKKGGGGLILLIGVGVAALALSGAGNGNGDTPPPPPPGNGNGEPPPGNGNGVPPPIPPIPPLPPPPVPPEFQGVEFVYTGELVVPPDASGNIFVTILGSYRGPAITLQARIGASDPSLPGEAVSNKLALPFSETFQSFSAATGSLAWAAGFFVEGENFNLSSRLVTLDDGGGVLQEIATDNSQVVTITASPVPPVPPVPPPPVPPPTPIVEFRNVVFSYVHLARGVLQRSGEIPSNKRGDVRVEISGEARGEATFIQARIGSSDAAFGGGEGRSELAPIPPSETFRAFGVIQSGNIGWDAWSFPPNSIWTLLARLVQTDSGAQILADAATDSKPQIITTDPRCLADSDEDDWLVTDDSGERRVLMNPFGNDVFISEPGATFRFIGFATNGGSNLEAVHFEVVCGFIFQGVFATTDTLIGPTFIVIAGSGFPALGGSPITEVTFDVSFQGFSCATSTHWRVRMVSAKLEPACHFISGKVSFNLKVGPLLMAGHAEAAELPPGRPGLSAGHVPAIAGAGGRSGSYF